MHIADHRRIHPPHNYNFWINVKLMANERKNEKMYKHSATEENP